MIGTIPSAHVSGAHVSSAHATIAIGEIAHRFGLADRTDPRTVIRHIRAQIAYRHFPLPLTPRLVKGVPQHGPKSVTIHARWARHAVDAWFDGPPHTGAAPTQPGHLAETLANRARHLIAGRAAGEMGKATDFANAERRAA